MNAPTLDGRLEPAVKALRAADPVMREIVERVGPCRLATSKEPLFASLAESIVYQQLAGKAAASIWGRVVAIWDGELAAPRVVLRTPLAKLRGAGLSGAKAAAVLDLALHASNGSLPLEQIERMGDDEVLDLVTGVRGIGPWTAHMFLIFRLGRPDILPVGDYGVRKAAQKAYRMRQLPTPERLTRVAEPWRPWRSVASWYLWRSLDL